MVILAITIGIGFVMAIGFVVYAAHIRGSASALIASAVVIHSTEDAQREIANWRTRAGEHFWRETDRLGGDHDYDAQIENELISRLRLVQPTELTLGITMRGGKLRCVTIVMTTGRKPSATSSVWVQEWFDSQSEAIIRVNQKGRPWKAIVDLTSGVPDKQRREALALNPRCFVRPGGCGSAEEILPGVWELASSINANSSQ